MLTSPKPVSWMPVEVVAMTFVDLIFAAGQLPQLINVVHPHPVAWKHIVNWLFSSLDKHYRLVSASEWVLQLADLADGTQDPDLTSVVSSSFTSDQTISA